MRMVQNAMGRDPPGARFKAKIVRSHPLDRGLFRRNLYSMRLTATRESFERGEITALACVETVLSIFAELALACWRDTANYYFMSIFLSPLLLVRTPQSTEMGVRWFAWLEANTLLTQRLSPNSSIRKVIDAFHNGKLSINAHFIFSRLSLYFVLYILISVIVQLIIVPIGALVIRITCTLVWCYRTRGGCIKEIPRNWRRMALQTDMCLSPEYVPGYEVLGHKYGRAQHNLGTIRDFALQKMIDSIQNLKKSMLSGTFRLLFYCSYLLFFTVIKFIPSMLYRLAIKSTSIVWFVLAPGFYERRPRLLSSQLWLDPMVWMSRFVAVVTLFSLVIHLLPQIERLKIVDKFSAISPFEYLLLVELDAIPPWGWLALANAFIAVGLFFLRCQVFASRQTQQQYSCGPGSPAQTEEAVAPDRDRHALAGRGLFHLFRSRPRSRSIMAYDFDRLATELRSRLFEADLRRVPAPADAWRRKFSRRVKVGSAKGSSRIPL